jgi:protein-tyrosine phosphatase
MIDTHCHLLPGVDDGPATPGEALELARSLAQDGVSFVLCTPHYSRRHPTVHAVALERLSELETALDGAGIALKAAVAAEVSPGFAISAPVEELSARSIAGQFLLVEVQPDTQPDFFAAVEARLAGAGLMPIFAHPERCHAVQRRPDVLDAGRRNGSLVQVVAPSLVGRWGRSTAAAAWRLVDAGRADLVASDAHGHVRRRSHLREAANLIAARLGVAAAARLTQQNPALVISGSALIVGASRPVSPEGRPDGDTTRSAGAAEGRAL